MLPRCVLFINAINQIEKIFPVSPRRKKNKHKKYVKITYRLLDMFVIAL